MANTPTSAGEGPSRLGRYVIKRRLGSGAFATVYRAVDPALDAPVAIKLLADHHSSNPDLRRRFIAEARTMRRAARERMVAVHDIGEEDGRPFLVMEYAAGGTLADRMDGRGSLSTSEAVRLVDELNLCLRDLGAAGIVHRDIKPSNVMIRSRGDEHDGLLGPREQLVLGDFGLARAVDASSLTVAGGTLGFMAPEQQLPGATVDHRADLYAATVIVAAAVTGLPSETAVRELSGRRTTLGAAVRRGTEPDPVDRHATADDWAADLRRALTDDLSTPRRRRTTALVVALVAMLAAVGAWVARDPGPAIEGPREITAGEAAEYTVAEPEVGNYFWTDWTGEVYPTPGLRVIASGPGRLPITLTHVVDGERRDTTIEVTVRAGEG